MPEVAHVSDTAFWVANLRARESTRKHPLFVDPFAQRLGGERGDAITRADAGHDAQDGVAVRTWLLDQVIQDAVRSGFDGVANLACGLDARPFRLSLPRDFQWFEVDFPHVLAYKREALGGAAPHCRLEQIPLDLSNPGERQGALRRIGMSAVRVLVITEGLLEYLDEPTVLRLAQDLATVPSFRQWWTNLSSPLALRHSIRQRGALLKNAPFHFAPEAGARFFEARGWREARFWSHLDEAQRLRRGPRGGWLLRALRPVMPVRYREALARGYGYVLLERV